MSQFFPCQKSHIISSNFSNIFIKKLSFFSNTSAYWLIFFVNKQIKYLFWSQVFTFIAIFSAWDSNFLGNDLLWKKTFNVCYFQQLFTEKRFWTFHFCVTKRWLIYFPCYFIYLICDLLLRKWVKRKTCFYKFSFVKRNKYNNSCFFFNFYLCFRLIKRKFKNKPLSPK